MNERIKSLYPSLVGSSTEFSFKKKLSNATSIERNIYAAKKRITHDVEMALEVGGELCVMLLAELNYFYRSEPYYMAVRSAIELRRYRPSVIEYMQRDTQERADRLSDVLSKKLRGDKYREVKITALRYFLATFPNRLNNFKKLLTREEYITVS